MNFIPNEDFFDEALRSHYCKGLVYTVRGRAPDPKVEGDKGTPLESTPLYAKVAEWVKDGKVRLQSAPRPTAVLTGRGKVT